MACVFDEICEVQFEFIGDVVVVIFLDFPFEIFCDCQNFFFWFQFYVVVGLF